MRLISWSKLPRFVSGRARSGLAGFGPTPLARITLIPARSLAQVRSDIEIKSEAWFTPSGPISQREQHSLSQSDVSPPDERTLKLGSTLRVLQKHLPTLLASPLPTEILSPHISLYLFPSTHPHLPTVSGRVPYHAALWTAPMAWGRVPILGNVRLDIISERIIKNGPISHVNHNSTHKERLTVRWKTCGKTKGKGMGALYRGIGGHEQVDKITEWLGGDVRDDQEFTGLFIFEFDEEGRILTHTIEHAEESGHWERTNRFVTITDWLLSRVNGKRKEPELALSYVRERQRGPQRRRHDT